MNLHIAFAPLTSNEVDSHCSFGFFRHHGLYRCSTKVLLHTKIMWAPSIGHHGPSGSMDPQLRSPVLFDQSTIRIICCVWYVFSTFCDVIVVKYF